ncbi:MAG: tetratricopeptide repeat protein, partial [Gammaproteobacteria bacterium]
MQPRFGIVPYLGRENLLTELEEWCISGDELLSVGLITGQGGSGKSRLAAELCTRVRFRGWDAGLASTKTPFTEQQIETPTLLVIDYPERWADELGELLERIAIRSSGPRTRVLLLARHRSDHSQWWMALDRESHRTATHFKNLDHNLAEYALSLEERQQHARAAVDAFASQLNISPGPIPAVDSEEFSNPLLIHTSALLAVCGEIPQDGSHTVRHHVMAEMITRERARWGKLQPPCGLTDLNVTHAARAVLVAALATPSADEVADLLAVLPELAGPEQRERRSTIKYWLAELYPGEPIFGTFGPDLLVEELLADAAERLNLSDVAAAICGSPACTPRHASHLLDTLRLASEQRQGPRNAFLLLLASHLPALVSQALEAPNDRLLISLENALSWCIENDQNSYNLAVASLQIHVWMFEHNVHSERGARLLYDAARLGIWAFRAAANAVPDSLPELAVGLTMLGNCAANAGQRAQALDATADAVKVYRQLAAQDPGKYLGNLAFELCNLSAAYANLGNHKDSASIAEEAVELSRQLPEQRSASQELEEEGTLARAWQCLGAAYFELERYEEALTANTEALPLHRKFAEQKPDYYLPVLITTLQLRGGILHYLGRYDEALAFTGEALRISKKITENQPVREEPKLAFTLNNQAQIYDRLGLHNEALEAAKEASQLFRDLVGKNPDRYHAYLVTALTNLALRYAEMGRLDDAVLAAEEAAELGRQVAEHEPHRQFEFMRSLKCLGDIYTTNRQYAEAFVATQEASDILGQLARTDPIRYRSVFAESLRWLADLDGHLSRHEEALGNALEAVTILRPLHAAHPDRYGNDLILALGDLADRYSQLGQFDEALNAINENLQLSRGQVDASSDHGLHNLASSLSRLSDIHTARGQLGEAIATQKQATTIFTNLAQDDPSRYVPKLAGSFDRLRFLYEESRQDAAALMVSRWQASVSEQLTNT